MNVKLEGNDPCVYIVSSETDAGLEYIVDLCVHPLGLDKDGNMDYNGACIGTRGKDEWLEHGCRDFIFRCEPAIRKPENMGRIYRCKHVRAARDYAFRLLLPYIAKNRPQQHDH